MHVRRTQGASDGVDGFMSSQGFEESRHSDFEASADQAWCGLDQSGGNLDEFWSDFAQSGVEVDRSRPKFGQFCPGFGQIQTKLGRIQDKSGQNKPRSADFAQIW